MRCAITYATSSAPPSARTISPSWRCAGTAAAYEKLLGGRLVNFDDELGAAYAHDCRRRFHAHGFGRLLDDLAGDHRERALLQRGIKLALVGSAVEHETLDHQFAVGARRQQAVVLERDAHRAIGAGFHGIARLDYGADRRGKALAVAFNLYVALRHFDAPRFPSQRGQCDQRAEQQQKAEHQEISL